MKKVVLAFSGGLDTSYCAVYLNKDAGLEVHSVFVNAGGFSADELDNIEQKAYTLGVKAHRTIDVTDQYYQQCIRYLIYGNILRNGTYPLSVSAERVFQARAIAEYANEIGADYIAHGSTGAGNDQVRFDMIFNIVAPQAEILTPIRDQQLTRDQEIQYLRQNGMQINSEKLQYSINQGLWGTSVGGKETLTSHRPLPEKAYPTTQTAGESKSITIHFSDGEFSGFDDRTFANSVEAIRALDALAAPFGIGRDIHVGDTIIGIKGRVGFEAAAPILLIKAHQALEKHTLTKWQIYWKDQLANWYGMMLHEGQFLDPVLRDIESYLKHSQQYVTGSVTVRLMPGAFRIDGIESVHDLMSPEFAAYGEMNLGWTGQDVRGFAKIMANQSRIYHAVNKK